MSGNDQLGTQIDFSELIQDPKRIACVQAAQIPAFLMQLSALQTALAARLIVTEQTSAEADTLLAVDEAAEHLGVSEDWIYRRTKTLPFVVRVGRHVRYSARGMEKYIRNKMGR
jgi:excisionase family DNA binding protein